MGQNKHPLDVFRSTGKGFENASRRRSVSGKVISSSVRKAPEAEREPPAAEPAPEETTAQLPDAAREDAPRPAAPPSRLPRTAPPARPRARVARRKPATVEKPIAQPGQPRLAGRRTLGNPPLQPSGGFSGRKLSQTLFGVSVAAMAILAVVIISKVGWGTGPDGHIPTLSAATVLEPGPGGEVTPPVVEPALSEWYTIRVCTYGGSLVGKEAAWAAYDGLVARGFPVQEPLGIPDGDGGVKECQLLVGAAKDKADLEFLLEQVKAVEWETGDKLPFRTASIVRHPDPGF